MMLQIFSAFLGSVGFALFFNMKGKQLAAAGIGVAKIAFLHVGEDGSLVLSKLFSIINWKAIVLALAIWYGLVKWKKHPIFYIVAAAVIGIVFQFH